MAMTESIFLEKEKSVCCGYPANMCFLGVFLSTLYALSHLILTTILRVIIIILYHI